MVTAMQRSLEYQLAQVDAVYQSLLNRSTDTAGQQWPADPFGTDFFAHALLNGATTDDILSTIFASPEYVPTAGLGKPQQSKMELLPVRRQYLMLPRSVSWTIFFL